jgi:GWxTD domain-containing protein
MKAAPIQIYRTCVSLVLFVGGVHAAGSAWLDRVAPVITPAEKKLYLSLGAEERRGFEDHFWSNKAITPEEYYRRLQYVDTTFGSGKTGSGANTDQGTVYLSIGAPTKVARFPSSRIFVPMEIWYYDVVPGLLQTELRLIFYQKNSLGFPKLYSPGVDTIRALLLPEASSVHMFGPNDSTNESDIRQVLRVPPNEDEIISAAANVATGVKYSGNMEILGKVTSPLAMLGQPPKTEVRSRLVTARAKLDVVESPSEYAESQIDLRFETTVAREVDLEVLAGDVTVYQNRLHLTLSQPGLIQYTHRLDLLPGSYRLIFTVDGTPSPYGIEVKADHAMGEIFRAELAEAGGREFTPFEFSGKHLDLNRQGKIAAVVLARPEKVTWKIRKGWEVVWKSESDPAAVATATLPGAGLPEGSYVLEAAAESGTRTMEFVVGRGTETSQAATVVSFNANLAPAARYTFAAHQWLLRGNFGEARKSLQASLEKGSTEDAQIEWARLDAFTGNLDSARDRVRQVLSVKPDQFEALSVYAYIETKFQDYAVAAELYRHALAVQDSPALRLALEKLPRQ